MYAFIPLDRATELPNHNGYIVRIPQYLAGFAPDLLDSNGLGIPNVLELEEPEMTEAQKADVIELGGQWFENAETYLAYKQQLV
ncbi:MAG: hypothetical protein ACK53T_07515 [Planctomycetota bacterium]|jgi:hypothetical protein